RRPARRSCADRSRLGGMVPVVESFARGWRVEVSQAMPAREVLAGLDQIAGLEAAAGALAGGSSDGRLAAAIEFVLEGLHLANRLNKRPGDQGALYAAR